MATEFWFKFNFKDWANDVRPLSLTARGMLLELIIYMRQTATIGMMPLDIRLIVRLTGCLTEEATESITEFKNFGIFDFVKNDDGSETIISRRIVKEFERSRINTANGKNGGNPTLKNKIRLTDSVNQNANQTSNSISNSNFNSNFDLEKKAWFKVFWEKYNKKQDSKKCLDKWLKLSDSEINAALDKVDQYVHSTPDVQFRKNPLTWLNGKCWEDEIITPMQLGAKTKSGQAMERNLAAELKFDENGNAIL
jgi:hypothetical protein